MAEIARKEDPGIRTLMAGSSPTREISANSAKVPRRKPVYPISAERELARAFLTVSRLIEKKSKPYIERLMAIYGVWADENVRTDARISLQDGIGMILEEYGEDIQKDLDLKAINKGAKLAARSAGTVSVRDWKALVDSATNAKISEPFYMESMEDMLNKWVGEAVSYIGSLPQEYLAKVHDIIIWGYNTHQPKVNVYRRLEKITGATKSQAKMIARDQLGTLNCRMTQYEHASLGVTQYIWVTRRDSLVRDCHRERNGKVFSWNNPPAEWYPTISRGIVYTGRYCHPGEAYSCRCTAKPVFDQDRVDAMVRQQKFDRGRK